MGYFILFVLLRLFLSVSAAPSNWLRRASGSSASAYCTSSDLTYQLSSITAPVQAYSSPSSSQTAWDLEVDDTSSGYKQTITGFGAAVTDATVISFNSLGNMALNQLLKTLMTSSGANFGLMRHTIGSSDLSPDPGYNYDANGGQPDLSLSNFDIGPNGTAMANLLSGMKTLNPGLTILGSPWSPPGWMKVNDNFYGETVNDNLSDQYLNQSQPSYAQQFANYFVKYIQAFNKLGATINAITIQNEPLYTSAGYPTMYMYDYEQAQLIQNFVGPALSSASLSTSIWAYDHNTDVPSYPQTVITNAGQYTNTVAWHCYAGNLNWSTLTTFRNNNPGVQQYMTECWTPKPTVSTTSTNWFQAANFTIGPLQNWASGVAAWTLGTNAAAGPHLAGGCSSCYGLVTINSDGSVTYNMAYYLMAQFSKFIPSGSTILSVTGSSTYQPASVGVQSVASLNPDGTRTVVVLNTMLKQLLVRVKTKSGQSWSGNVPSNSIVTWVLPKVS